MTHRAVFFHRAMAPYEHGDIAGFALAQAQKLVDRGIASFHPPEPTPAATAPVSDILDGMDRAQLIAFAKDKLGLTDEPGAEVDEDALRSALRANAEPALLQEEPSETPDAASGKKTKRA